MNIVSNLNCVLPEATLLIGSMILLLLGVYKKKNTFELITILCGLLLIQAIVITARRFFDINLAFNGMIDNFVFSSFAKILILICSASIMGMLFTQHNEKFAAFELPILITISTAGMMLVISSNSLLSLYLSLEVMSLPLYILAASNKNSIASGEAGIKYFILGSLASAFLLFGISLVYGYTGQINYDSLANYFSLSLNEGDSTSFPVGLLVGLIFITVAICFKISAAPFHMWAPDVYQGAPTIVTAFFASSAKATGLLLFIRIILDPFVMLYEQWVPILLFISILSMTIGAIAALIQKSMKRLLAYSSISHVGFALTGLVSGDAIGIAGLLLYIMLYLTMTIAIFAILLMLKNSKHEHLDDIQAFAGLAKQNKIIAFMIAVLMLSMAGIPPIAGFFAKFYVLLPALKQQLYLLAFVFVVCSVIGAYYYLKIIKVMYFDEATSEITIIKKKVLLIIATIFTTINIVFVLLPNDFLIIAQKVASIFIV